MARVSGLKALFTGKQLGNIFDQFQDKIHSDMLLKLQFIGEEFVNKARSVRTYRDRTGNLRSSIGYVILLDGKVIDKNFLVAEGKGKKGLSQAKAVSNEIAQQYPDGYVLIGVAGMQYAAYVEAKNYDVITGSAPGSNELKSIFGEINF